MSPKESSKAELANRVRCFAKNGLVESIAAQKWDLIQVFCIQPYNRHVQYGISFIKINAVAEATKEPKALVPAAFLNASNSSSPFAKFKLREESPDSEIETSSSLFARWKQEKNQTTETHPISC